MALNRRRSKWLTPYLFPIQRIPQNYIMIARTEANPILDLGWFNEEYLPLVGSDSGTFFGRTIADASIDCLIRWVQLASAVYHSPALNRPSLRAWTQLTYFLSFSSFQFSLSFSLGYEQNFLFLPVSKTPKGVWIISVWPLYSSRKFNCTGWKNFSENFNAKTKSEKFELQKNREKKVKKCLWNKVHGTLQCDCSRQYRACFI